MRGDRPGAWRFRDRRDHRRCRSPSWFRHPRPERARLPGPGLRRTSRHPGGNGNRLASLEARSGRDVLVKPGQYGLAVFDRCGHNHSVRFDAFHLARVQIGDDDNFAVQELLGSIGFGDAGHDGAGLGFADVDFHVHQFGGAFDALGGEDQTYAQIHFEEVVDGDLRTLRVLFGGLRHNLAEEFGLFGGDLFFQGAHGGDGFFQFDARKDGRDFSNFLARLQTAPSQRFETDGFDGFGHAELRPDFGRALGQHRRQERGGDAQRLGAGVQRGAQLALRHIVQLARQFPGGVPHDELVHGGDQSPHGFQALRELEAVKRTPDCLDGVIGNGRDFRIGTIRDGAGAVLVDHGQGAAGQVAQAVGEVRIVTADQRVVAEASVLAEDDFAEQEVAQSVGAHDYADGFGPYDVAARLAHLVAFEKNPSVRENLLGQGHSGRHDECRPEDGVEAQDFLTDQVQVGGPETFAIQLFTIHGAHVADEGVEPDVEHVLALHRKRDAPVQRSTADGKVVEAGANEREDFVAARVGLDEIGLRFVEFDQFTGEGGELEEVVFLGDGFGGPGAIKTRIAGLGVVDVELVGHAVLAGVTALVDKPVVHAALEEPLHHFVMARVGGADGPVDADVEPFPLGAEFGRDYVREFLRRFAGGLGGALHLLAVLVGAGEHHGVIALHAFEAGYGLGGHGGVRVPDVGRGIHVIQRSGEVVFHRDSFRYA